MPAQRLWRRTALWVVGSALLPACIFGAVSAYAVHHLGRGETRVPLLIATILLAGAAALVGWAAGGQAAALRSGARLQRLEQQ